MFEFWAQQNTRVLGWNVDLVCHKMKSENEFVIKHSDISTPNEKIGASRDLGPLRNVFKASNAPTKQQNTVASANREGEQKFVRTAFSSNIYCTFINRLPFFRLQQRDFHCILLRPRDHRWGPFPSCQNRGRCVDVASAHHYWHEGHQAAHPEINSLHVDSISGDMQMSVAEHELTLQYTLIVINPLLENQSSRTFSTFSFWKCSYLF